MTRAAVRTVEIGDDEPVTLAEACRVFFGGRLTPSALRTEAARGNLAIMQIARKDFVTRQAIEEMKRKCLRSESLPASGSVPKPAPTASPEARGSSRMPAGISAQDAARLILTEQIASSPNTSRRDTSRKAQVVHLRSKSAK
jgi:hypothetical protein